MEENNTHRKILVPVDYSEHSILAAGYALQIAHSTRAQVLFFHAFYSPAYDLIELAGNKDMQLRLQSDITEKLLIEENKKMADFMNSVHRIIKENKYNIIGLENELKPGSATGEIKTIANSFKPHLVVMGTRGAERRDTSILGSVTEYVIQKLKFPVLAIPENSQMTLKTETTHIVYLTDFDESDFMSIKRLMGITGIINPAIHCLHIGMSSSEIEIAKMEGLKNYFAYSYPLSDMKYEIIDKEGDILKSINHYNEKNTIDIISLTSRKRNLLEKIFKPSLTKKIFHGLDRPLLVFHET